jgi:glutaredoxin-like protein
MDKRLLDDQTSTQVKEILQNIQDNMEVILVKKNDEISEMAEKLYGEIAELSEKISLKVYNETQNEILEKFNLESDLLPATVIMNSNVGDQNIRFLGIPAGHEFGTFLQDLVAVSSKRNDLGDEATAKIASIEKEMRIRVFITPTCPHYPGAVFKGHQSAMINSKITAQMIDANNFHDLSTKNGISSVPHTVIEVKENGNWEVKNEFVGDYPVESFVEELLKA